jgi:hypothetical protein
MRATEFIVEYRNSLLQYVKRLLPAWPEYVLKDWLVPNKGDFSNLPDTELKNGIMEKLKGAGLTPDSKWQLVPDMKFTMDMFDPKTKQLLIGRAGGSSDLGMQIPRDAERHATQAQLAQQQGGVRKEPVLLIKTDKGYELLEGWHRTIQHFHKFPDGYTGPAYVTVAQGQQGVAEGKVINTYLWHGSRQKIPMLEPRQSVDTGGAAGSNQNAIYATSDPKVAIAMGLTTAGSDTGMFPNDPQMVLFSGKIRKGEYVYLHKLPFNGPDGKPQFVQGGNSREFHSIPGVEGIKPIEIKEIPVNKYLNLIRKATPADLKLRKKYMKKQGVAEDDTHQIKGNELIEYLMKRFEMTREQAIELLKKKGLAETEKQRLDPHCWKGYRKAGTKMKGGTRVNNCVPVREDVEDLMAGYIKLLENKQ